MMNKKCLNSEKINFSGILLLVFLNLTIYSNTLNASWHFDDFPTIIQNNSLHISNISFGSILNTFFAEPVSGNRFYRPISCLTFAINWYLGKDSVTGYHIINILIHILNTLLLFFTIHTLFKTPNLKGKYQKNEYFIALLASGLWAINPIQTQAVTYIVQRMTLLASMFYILGILFYTKARISDFRLNCLLLFSGCFICFFLALGSKENAVILPLSLLLVEICFFQTGSAFFSQKFYLKAIPLVALCALFTGTIILFFTGDLLFFFKGYDARPFSILERLITEPRVIIFYISQIFYPIPQRLSFAHDITISTSLFQPWTTLPAIILLFILIGIGFSQIRKRPVLAFSILFFFLNHIVESSVISLELIFEHRNYLPSMFLFFPITAGLKQLMDHYNKKNYFIYLNIICFITIIITSVGIGTFIRNTAWATEASLWSDAVQKAPGNARANQNVAHYYKKNKQYNHALVLYKHSLSLYSERPKQSNALAYNNMGNIYLEKQEYEMAISYYEKALSVFPTNQRSRLNMIKSLIRLGKWEDALMNVDQLLSGYFFVEECLHLRGLILLRQKNYKEAVKYLRRALKLNPDNPEVMVCLGMALNSMACYKHAELFLKQAKSLQPDSALIMLCLFEVSIRSGKPLAADEYLEYFCEKIGEENVVLFLENQIRDNFSVPLDYQLIIPVIAKKHQTKVAELAEISSELTISELSD